MIDINYTNFYWSWVEFCGTSDKFPIWNPIHRDLDVCFQYLCLHIPILCLIAVISAYYSGLQVRHVRRRKKEVWVLRFRSGITLFLSALPIVRTYMEISLYPGSLHAIDYLVTAVESFTWLIHFIYIVALNNRLGPSLRGPVILGVLWAFNFILSCILLHSNYLILEKPDNVLYLSHLPFSFSWMQVSLHTLYLITLFPSEDLRPVHQISSSSVSGEHSPLFGVYSRFREEVEAGYLGVAGEGWGLISRLSFSWVTPLLKKGLSSKLTTPDDLFELPTSLTSSYLYMKLRSALTEDSLYGTNRVSLLRALHCAFWKPFYSIGILKLISDVASFCGPILLHRLVTFIQEKNEPIQNGYLYALALFIITFSVAVCLPQFQYLMSIVSLKIRGAVITTIYRKILSVNTITLSQFSQGEILNFMSTDTDRIVNSCASFHAFWSIPFQLFVTLYLLYLQVGLSFLAGVAFSIVLIPINKFIASKIGSLSTKMMSEKDNRIRLINEIMKGIRAVKLYVWENVFLNKVEEIRKNELKYLGGRKYLDAMCVYFWATTPVLISILTFSVYIYAGNTLNAPVVFTTMALLNMLISPLNAFPWVLNGLMEAWVSLKRVQQLLNLPEQNLEDYYTNSLSESIKPGGVVITSGNFHWREANSTSLISINLLAQQGKLIGITGPVGSGKSSLLSAILAEMEKSSGSVICPDSDNGFAFVGQSPWLQRGSIQSNILFGDMYDHQRYCGVVESCALLEDFECFRNGDQTNVGEGGSTLSGGQRARVALARAVYKDLSVYLLDDILSSVDPRVARHIFNHCILGALKTKTRILCTHQSKYLVNADWIVVMEGGTIVNQGVPSVVLGDYEEIMANSELEEYEPAAVETEIKSEKIVSPDEEMQQEEEKATGSLELTVYGCYISSVGVLLAIGILLSLALMQASRNSVDWWMAFWVSQDSNTFPNNTITRAVHNYLDALPSLSDDDNVWFYLKIYIILAGVNSVLTLLRAFIFAYGGLVAAKKLHTNLIVTVLWASSTFFDVTPLGRLLNRFSSDLYTIDDSLPFIMNIFMAQLFTLLGSLVMTLYGIPWLCLILAPIVPIYHWLQNHYRQTSREIKRISSISLSPLYNHFNETIHGLVTIRAFRATSRFKRDSACYLELTQKAQLNANAISNWLSLRLQMIGVALVTGVAILAILQYHLDVANPGLIGLAISYALTMSNSLSGVINAFTETEREMVSVERVRQYLIDPLTNPGPSYPTVPIPFAWPPLGVVSFQNVSLRYRDHLPFSLLDVSFESRPAERIGIVGRTGSGKSSLFAALFRLVDVTEGEISIDRVNISNITTKQLRSRMGIIPQEPFVFGGSVKDNLDPECEKSEAEMWTALSRCHLATTIRSMAGGLNAQIKSTSLSAGQRQLLCLARAILRTPKIVCIDEATANVDKETDRLIQQTIRSCFRQSTVITIAHRVSTVLDNDRVLVMGGGQVLEFDNPNLLLQNTNSHFYQLVNEPYR